MLTGWQGNPPATRSTFHSSTGEGGNVFTSSHRRTSGKFFSSTLRQNGSISTCQSTTIPALDKPSPIPPMPANNSPTVNAPVTAQFLPQRVPPRATHPVAPSVPCFLKRLRLFEVSSSTVGRTVLALRLSLSPEPLALMATGAAASPRMPCVDYVDRRNGELPPDALGRLQTPPENGAGDSNPSVATHRYQP